MRRHALPVAVLACLLGGLWAAQVRGGPASTGPGLIVYWKESPFPSIWSIRPDGKGARKILAGRQNAKRARLSPDRTWVAFDGAPPGKQPLSDFDIQIVRLDGSDRRTLTSADNWDIDAQWSPDGERLAFTRGGRGNLDWPNTAIWTIRRDGTDLRRLGPGSDARWSPDGTELVFDAPTARSQGDVFLMNADGTNRRQLHATRKLEGVAGWSPDGRKILFTRFNDSSGRNADVFVMNADGTNIRRLAQGVAGSWSPNGKRIVYTNSLQLRIMNADGSHKRKIRSAGVWDPDWR
jgi:dipeptidyl aminopeptidase/acylaminoacyl peptidase